MVRYSFPVGLFHSLLHAGLSRRTDGLILHSLRSPESYQVAPSLIFQTRNQPRVVHWPGTGKRSNRPSRNAERTAPRRLCGTYVGQPPSKKPEDLRFPLGGRKDVPPLLRRRRLPGSVRPRAGSRGRIHARQPLFAVRTSFSKWGRSALVQFKSTKTVPVQPGPFSGPSRHRRRRAILKETEQPQRDHDTN